MDNYYVTKAMKSNGCHEVHTENCRSLPHPDETMYIGYFSNCVPAVEKAKRFYRRVTGCRVCSRHCATVAEEIVLR